ncbi:hypothetical protein ACJQWK_01381 [Exserohilum turcicum]|uniref:Uncharacterized protein n=1 Tax=Exserohilum turcicum (strain 28A) TaxID=671987 RepID=R0KG32_EXST2|nr:uncharacterized protein SETTUDRAFT_38929 [Exserohilum turcica Et28A]EOA88259.1 hypothetical protein SETTUDRAFT_38929 [Exserohilum turcica Et28A]
MSIPKDTPKTNESHPQHNQTHPSDTTSTTKQANPTAPSFKTHPQRRFATLHAPVRIKPVRQPTVPPASSDLHSGKAQNFIWPGKDIQGQFSFRFKNEHVHVDGSLQ